MSSAPYLDALLSLPGMYTSKVSRDGKWVAWTWLRTGPAGNIYLTATDGKTAPIRLTDTMEDTFMVAWTPDSRAVIVEQDKDGNERTQLFRVDIAHPLDMHPLTEASPNYFIRGGAVHPNGKWLVYGANVNLGTGAEIEPTLIYRHDLETGERRVLAYPQKPAYIVPRLSPTGNYVLYTRTDRDPAGEQVWLVDIAGERDREIINVGDALKAFATWFPDGQRAVVLAETATHRRLGIWTLADGSLHWLVDDPARNIEEAFVPAGCDHIVVMEIKQTKLRCSLLDPENGKETRLPNIPGNLQLLAPVAGKRWVGRYYSSQHPTELVRFSLDDVQPTTFQNLSRVWSHTQLTKDDFTPSEDFHWQSVDGLEIQGWLYRSKHQPAQGTLVYVHGGPTAHSQDSINNQIQFFTQQGFNVLDPNYRGSSGFSLAYQQAIKATFWGGLEQDDIRAGIEALTARGIAEAGKVGITGTSYGGYASWHAITHFPLDILAAAAPICGMTDLVVDYESTRPDLRSYSEAMLGGAPSDVPKRYQERSPINFVDNIQGKLLIIQGLQDPNVSPENVRAVRKALDKAHITYEVLTFDDEGHGISKPKNQKVLYQRLATFFAAAFAS